MLQLQYLFNDMLTFLLPNLYSLPSISLTYLWIMNLITNKMLKLFASFAAKLTDAHMETCRILWYLDSRGQCESRDEAGG